MSQIFKHRPPNELLENLLKHIAYEIESNIYMVNNESFKKGMYTEIIPAFVENCKQYYFLSKRRYLERKLTYQSFITILRQICKHNNISYRSEVKYNHSEYGIVYTVSL
jgi:hypothetical protein